MPLAFLVVTAPVRAVALPLLALPFPCGTGFSVTQGHHAGTHTGFGAWAWDFGLPEGAVVTAAAAGTVTHVKLDSTLHCDNATCAEAANRVVVDHGDGTAALYMHLQAGSGTLTVGDAVEAGQPLAQVGLSGWVTGAHLHFQVQQACEAGWCQSVQVGFMEADDPQPPSLVTSGNCGVDPLVVRVDERSTGFLRNNGFFAAEHAGGFGGHFFWSPGHGSTPSARGRWSTALPEDAVYQVELFVPRWSRLTATSVPVVIHHVGGHEEHVLDQTRQQGSFVVVGAFKMAAAEALRVEVNDGTGVPEGSDVLAWDTLQLRRVAPAGTTPEGSACSTHQECTGLLACVQRHCASGPAAHSTEGGHSGNTAAADAGGPGESAEPTEHNEAPARPNPTLCACSDAPRAPQRATGWLVTVGLWVFRGGFRARRRAGSVVRPH